MSQPLGDLLRRTADAASEPRVDVGELVSLADLRRRRRRLAALAGTTALVAAVAAAPFVLGDDPTGHPSPAPSPSPTVVDPSPDHVRPLVYAVGSTVHVGSRSVDAGATVWTLDVTDDGAVWVTEDSDDDPWSDPVWFSDGSTPVEIGRVPTEHYSRYDLHTAGSGSLVVWPDATTGSVGDQTRFVVYDSSRREVVARIPFVGRHDLFLHVDTDHVYFNPDPGRPGCWVLDVQDLDPCADPHLFRYDVASGRTTEITRSAMDAELVAGGRIFTARTRDGAVVLDESPQLAQEGRRLVADGARLRLRVPPGYRVPGDVPEVNQVSYWLDDDTVVVAAGDSAGDVPPTRGDLLVCHLPDGDCRVAQRDVTLATR